MAARRVLVIEDDDAIRRGLVDSLALEGIEPSEAPDGRAGLRLALESECDLVLLDLMLPFVSGLDVLREIRSARPALPVIILSALGEERDRVAGLKLGADDYIVKPCGRAELLARIEAVLRRTPERPRPISTLRLGAAVIDLERRVIENGSGAAELSEREAELLRYMAANRGRILSREELLLRVWRLDPRGLKESRTVDISIARLRDRLRDACGAEPPIRTVRGRGYEFTAGSDEP